ncbi:MAG: polyhydroxyalkanoate synthesis regulator [Candidatus Aenigmatarchaeota archaeon]|nr:MAG: polyhydroxyalkanoate synthesis regulator [Candidatus Aenigmarchaeota archaeon]
MKDFLKKAVNLGLGGLLVTKEKVEAIVSELVKEGEVRQEEAKKLVEELLKKGDEGKKEIGGQIEKLVRNIVAKLDLPSRKELNELKLEVEKLRKKIDRR